MSKVDPDELMKGFIKARQELSVIKVEKKND